jgi:hypothetical protein
VPQKIATRIGEQSQLETVLAFSARPIVHQKIATRTGDKLLRDAAAEPPARTIAPRQIATRTGDKLLRDAAAEPPARTIAPQQIAIQTEEGPSRRISNVVLPTISEPNIYATLPGDKPLRGTAFHVFARETGEQASEDTTTRL